MSECDITITIMNYESFDPDIDPKNKIKLTKRFEISRPLFKDDKLGLDKELGFFKIDFIFINVEENVTYTHSLREEYSDESYNKTINILKSKGWKEL